MQRIQLVSSLRSVGFWLPACRFLTTRVSVSDCPRVRSRMFRVRVSDLGGFVSACPCVRGRWVSVRVSACDLDLTACDLDFTEFYWILLNLSIFLGIYRYFSIFRVCRPPGRVPRGTTVVRTMPITHYPGYHHPMLHYPVPYVCSATSHVSDSSEFTRLLLIPTHQLGATFINFNPKNH